MNRIFIAFVVLCFPLAPALATPPDFATQIQQNLKAGKIGKQRLFSHPLLTRLYPNQHSQPLWTQQTIPALADAILGLSGDGLNPDDYWSADINRRLKQARQGTLSPAQTAKLDLLLTEAYLRALYHLRFGKANPSAPRAFQLNAPGDNIDRTPLLLSFIRDGRIEDAFHWARPFQAPYRQLRQILNQRLEAQIMGGWPKIPAGPTLSPGDNDRRIPQLRKRLVLSGDLPDDRGPEQNDISLQAGIKQFQQRHGLTADGFVGANTLKALNQELTFSIQQLRLNLERLRWVLPLVGEDYLLIDTNDLTAERTRGPATLWVNPVDISKACRTLHSQSLSLDQLHLGPAPAPWFSSSQLSTLQLHQSSDPNKGCIQLDQVSGLSRQSLKAQGWDAARIDTALSGKKPQDIKLKRPLSLLLIYRTLKVKRLALWYSADPLKRDAELLQTLNAPLHIGPK